MLHRESAAPLSTNHIILATAASAPPWLAENLRRVLTGQPLVSYIPQKITLALISAGDRYAVASWGGIAFEGKWVWRWKDYIDRQFIAKYNAPPQPR